MIGTLLRIGFINLRRDRVVQALTFLLPIMFFSIFASVCPPESTSTAKASASFLASAKRSFPGKVPKSPSAFKRYRR